MSRFWYWLPTLVWMIIIFSFSSLPSVQTTNIVWQDFLLKKTAHFVEYFILTWLIFRSLRNTTNFSFTVSLFLSLTLSILYAISDEFHQSLVPGREPKLRDVIIDSLGALAASFISQARHHHYLIV